MSQTVTTVRKLSSLAVVVSGLYGCGSSVTPTAYPSDGGGSAGGAFVGSSTGGSSAGSPEGGSAGTSTRTSTATSVPTEGGTEVSAGSVSGTWSLAGSPYRINGDITISAGQTLTLEPGVIVAFSGRYKFIVLGGLSAVGTAAQRIVFTTTLPALTWWGMLVDHCVARGTGVCSVAADSVLPTRIKYVIVENARKDDALDRDWFAGGGLNFNGTNGNDNKLSIINTIFRNDYAIDGDGGLHLVIGNALVFGCLFVRNQSGSTGSAFGFEHGGGRVLNSTVVNNSGLGAIDSFDTGTELNNIMYGNHDSIRGWGDMHVKWDMSFDIAVPSSYSQLALSATDLSGIDPLFVDADAEDFGLSAGSPAINAAGGLASLLVGGETLPETDLAGQPRVCDTTMDVGAFEYCP